MARIPNNKDPVNGQNGQTDFRADPITIKQIDDLSSAQRQRIDYVMRSICPKGNIIGVMVTPRSWDLRPFVQVAGEPEPSMIRFLGPEVALLPKLEDRIRKMQKFLSKLHERQHMSREWGELEGQIWYRRKLIDRTFEDLLVERRSFSLDEAIALSVQTAEEIVKFHVRDVFHGHVTPQNIAIDRNGSVTIIDKTIGASVVQAAKIASNGEYPQGYMVNTFAPELLEGDDLSSESDFYGFGRVFKLIFGLVNTDYFGEEQNRSLAHIQLFLESMTSVSVDERPSFSEYFSLLSSIGSTKTEQDFKFEVNEDKRKPITTGKVVQTKKPQPKSPVNNSGEKREAQPRTENNAQARMGFRRDNPKPQKAPDFQLKNQEQKKNEREQKTNKIKEVRLEAEEKIQREAPAEIKDTLSAPPLKKPARRPTADFKFVDDADAFIVDDVSYKKASMENSFDDYKDDSPRPEPEILAPKDKPGKLSNKFLFLVGVIAAVVLYGLFSGKADNSYDSAVTREYTNEELQALWTSGLPSKMTNVVAAAVSPVHSNPQAAQLIIASAMRNEDNLPSFKYDLIRIAFNGLWEAELNDNDRRAALVLASGKMFKNPPTEGLTLDKLNPAILFAITATSGKDEGQFLSQISAKEFERLPAPISSAYVVLNAMYPNLSCGDERVRMLAQIVTGGYNNAQLVSKFVQEDSLIRLQALAQAFSRAPDQARSILGIVLSHPNLQLKDANADWARKFELSRWPELDANDQLLLLAGIPPQKDIEVPNIGKMFAHPSPEVRAFAIAKAIDTIKFSHPGAIEVLSILKESPDLLDANQTFRLAQFLENPAQTNNKAVRDSVVAWLKTDPKPELLIKMLVASSVSEKATMLDFEISRYVQEKGWRPSVEELSKLVVHPEQFTRLFAYSEAFLIPDRKVAVEILKKALKHESDPRFKARIEENLAKLSTK